MKTKEIVKSTVRRTSSQKYGHRKLPGETCSTFRNLLFLPKILNFGEGTLCPGTLCVGIRAVECSFNRSTPGLRINSQTSDLRRLLVPNRV